MKKVSKQILTWFEDNFQDGKIDDSYHKRIVNGVVSSYATKAKLKEELSDFINSLQQEQPNKESLNKAIDSDELDSQQEQQEVNIEKEIEEHIEGMPMSEFTHESEVDTHYGWARKEFRYFFELGQREMRHRIMNPEYNTKVIERLKSEYPTIKED